MSRSRCLRYGIASASLAAAVLATSLGCDSKSPPSQQPAVQSRVTILVAASAKEAVEAIAADFEKTTGTETSVSVGASNALAQQVIAGAPADLFLSASEEWADAVEKENFVAERVDLLTNQLVLVVPHGNPAGVKTPSDLLSDKVAHVAIAAENVPAGTYAEQALTKLELFGKLVDADRLARGHDVRATLSFVERGEAEAGVVYATDAIVSKAVDTVYEFESSLHDPIIYPLVLLKRGKANPTAVRLFKEIQSERSLETFRSRAFLPVTPVAAH